MLYLQRRPQRLRRHRGLRHRDLRQGAQVAEAARRLHRLPAAADRLQRGAVTGTLFSTVVTFTLVT